MRTDSAHIAARLSQIRERIHRAAGEARGDGAPAGRVRLVAVTKYLEASQMTCLRAGGLEIFGESRAQDALPKLDFFAGRPVEERPLAWHFIGSLQGNKVKSVVGRFKLIHSVDRLDLAQRISAAAGELGIRQSVLLQANVSGEAQKHGFSADSLMDEWAKLNALPDLEIEGLMGMAADDPREARAAFRRLRLLRDGLDPHGERLRELSMGMSGDFTAAVAEGATLVRIGHYLYSEETGS